MKFRRYVIALAVSFTFALEYLEAQSDLSSLRWHQWDEGVASAQSGNKKMVVDVFTTWCGWCKRMDRQVYGNQTVQEILAAYYVPVKLNGESQSILSFEGNKITEQDLSKKFNVSGYPTTLFFDENRELIVSVPGFVDTKRFINILNFIASNSYQRMTFKQYESSVEKSGE